MHNNYFFMNYNNYIQAISHYRKALQLNPDDGEMHYELGTLLLSMVSGWYIRVLNYFSESMPSDTIKASGKSLVLFGMQLRTVMPYSNMAFLSSKFQ